MTLTKPTFIYHYSDCLDGSPFDIDTSHSGDSTVKQERKISKKPFDRLDLEGEELQNYILVEDKLYHFLNNIRIESRPEPTLEKRANMAKMIEALLSAD